MNFLAGGVMPGANPSLMSTNRNMYQSGGSGFWGGNNGFWGTSDGGWFVPSNGGIIQAGMGSNAGFGNGYAPMGYEDLMPRAEPLGIYKTYAQHSDEVVLTMRDPSTSKHRDHFTVVDNATGQTLFTVKNQMYSVADKKNVFDFQGNFLFQIRRKGLPFLRDAYIGVDPMTQRTIFTCSGRDGPAGGLGIQFLNTAGAGEQTKMTLGADMYAAASRLTDSHGQTIARINRDVATMYKYPFNTHDYTLSVTGHVDTALMVAICICIDERMSRVPGLHR